MSLVLHFTISELCIDPNRLLPLGVADRLLKYHILEVNPIRAELGVPIWASQRSGYRSKQWEREHNRDPEDPNNSRSAWSRHTFEPLQGKDPEGLGAIDWTTRKELIRTLAAKLATDTNYTRLCYYPKQNFIHCDYAFKERGQRYFINNNGWNQVGKLNSWLKKI